MIVVAGAESGTVSDLLFGHNLEHTRSCIWRGLSAELVRNRKFAGIPRMNGLPADWYPIGTDDCLFFLHETEQHAYTCSYPSTEKRFRNSNERQSQRVQCLADGRVCGIGQNGLHLIAKTEYELPRGQT